MSGFAAERIFESPPEQHYFFGYFNIPQVSRDDRRVLGLRVDIIDRVPEPTDEAVAGYFDLETPGRFHEIGRTNAFNWQQGALLQFLGPDFSRRAVFNRFDGERFVAEIVDLVTGERRNVAAPIYAVFPDGKSALTLDFARHYWCRRGYSYGNIVDPAKNRPVVDGDGIWTVDLETGATRRIISIERMLALNPISTMPGATHYLEHMVISPDGERFAFLHRWKMPSGGIHSRLCLSDRTGETVRVLNDSGRMSHYCWRDGHTLIGYGGIANSLTALRKRKTLVRSLFKYAMPIYRALVRDNSSFSKVLTGDGYLSIDVRSGKIIPIAPQLRSEDGHPAMLNPDVFITDTYARSKFDQNPKLLAYDLASGSPHEIDEVASMAEFDETPLRCDLHPRVSRSGRLVSIDTMDGGRRGLYVYRVTAA